MGLRVSTNVQSLAAQGTLKKTKQAQDLSLQKLSSGSRITKAGDDAAGLAISEKLKADIRGSRQAQRNAGDGVSMVQVAEGGLNEVSNILIRLRELSVQAASDTVGEKERAFTNLEFQSLIQEVDRITGSTKYNGRSLINGEGGVLDFQVGIMNNEFNDRISYAAEATDAKSETLGIVGLDVSGKESAQENLAVIDQAITKVNGSRAGLGALQNRLESTIGGLQTQTENLQAANSRIRDTDVAEVTAELTKQNILSQAGINVLSQANQSPNTALRLLG